MSFYSFWSLCVAATLILVCPQANSLTLRSNDFAADPQWTGFNNTTSPNAFGYSAGTTNATGITANAGEIGGTTARNNFDGYYADTALTETLTLNHEISGAGSLVIKNPNAWDHTAFLGHFGTSAVDDYLATI